MSCRIKAADWVPVSRPCCGKSWKMFHVKYHERLSSIFHSSIAILGYWVTGAANKTWGDLTGLSKSFGDEYVLMLWAQFFDKTSAVQLLGWRFQICVFLHFIYRHSLLIMMHRDLVGCHHQQVIYIYIHIYIYMLKAEPWVHTPAR